MNLNGGTSSFTCPLCGRTSHNPRTTPSTATCGACHAFTGSVASPVCPRCGQPPTIVMAGAVQAFCGTEGCPVLCWDPRDTPEVFEATAVTHDLTPTHSGSNVVAESPPDGDGRVRSPKDGAAGQRP